MDEESAEIVADSQSEDENRPSKEEDEVSLDHRELIDEYDKDRMRDILSRWYNIDFAYRLDFPEEFGTVPAQHSADKIWRVPMAHEEVCRWLLGEEDNVSPNQLPAAIIRCYSKIVDYASKKFADLQKRLDDNEHHICVLERAKENGKTPNFLMLKPPEVRLFPEESAANLQQRYRKILDAAAQEMLRCTLKERYLLRAKLCKEAEELIEDVKSESVTKWMEAQGDGWNGWDHLYPVTAEVRRGNNTSRVIVPLSAIVYRMAMKSCRLKVSTLMETIRLENADKEAARRREQKRRKAALAQASALPRQEAEKSIERRIKDIVDPLRAEISSIKERLQGNRNAPNVADAGGAAAKSAQSSRSADVHRKAVDGDQDAASESRTRKRKRRRRSTEMAAVKAPALASPDAVPRQIADQAKRPGPNPRGKQGRRGSKGMDQDRSSSTETDAVNAPAPEPPDVAPRQRGDQAQRPGRRPSGKQGKRESKSMDKDRMEESD